MAFKGSATFGAAAKSGDPSKPTAKECKCGYQASEVSVDSIRFCAYFFAIAEVIEESNPPESKTP